jgi:hypothetical protein
MKIHPILSMGFYAISLLPPTAPQVHPVDNTVKRNDCILTAIEPKKRTPLTPVDWHKRKHREIRPQR